MILGQLLPPLSARANSAALPDSQPINPGVTGWWEDVSRRIPRNPIGEMRVRAFEAWVSLAPQEQQPTTEDNWLFVTPQAVYEDLSWVAGPTIRLLTNPESVEQDVAQLMRSRRSLISRARLGKEINMEPAELGDKEWVLAGPIAASLESIRHVELTYGPPQRKRT